MRRGSGPLPPHGILVGGELERGSAFCADSATGEPPFVFSPARGKAEWWPAGRGIRRGTPRTNVKAAFCRMICEGSLSDSTRQKH